MKQIIFNVCAALVLASHINSQVVQPNFLIENNAQPQHMMPPQHMMEHQRAPHAWHFDHDVNEQHLQMSPDQHHHHISHADDQQLGSILDPFSPLNPANPFSSLNPLNLRNPLNKFHPLNPFNPLRIPGGQFSHLSAGRVGPFLYGNSLLGAGNPMEEAEHLQSEHQQFDSANLGAPAPCSACSQLQAPMPAEYYMHEAEPQHYNLQAPSPAEYYLQEPQHYNMEQQMPAEYYLQEPHHQHFQEQQLQEPMHSEYYMRGAEPQHNLQAPMPAGYYLQEPQQMIENHQLQQAQFPSMENIPFPSLVTPEPLELIAGPAEENQRSWGDWKNLWGKKDYE